MMAKKSISSADALKENTAALKAHTQELKRHTAALMAHTAALAPTTATKFVYGILPAPSTLPASTALAKLGWTVSSLSGLAARINAQHWHGVHVDTALIQRCTTIADVVSAVAAAEA
jgi:hypothetical protein